MTDSDPRSDPLASSTKEHAKCQKCGASMRLDTGVCVSCLLRQGLEGAEEISQAFYQSVLAEAGAPPKSWFLGNYEILEQIGCGGMGVIYRARQRHSRRIVAVKRVLSYRADSDGALQRFRREAQAVASLDHPNILPIYEVSESEDGLPFFSMKFAKKGSLRENVASLRDEPRKCVQLIAKVARAVEYAHSRGVLHRDLKPGNILLDDRGEPLVSDFGLAKLLDANNDLTRSLTTFGTAGFIAPEQAGGAAADFTAAADVYSLGAVLFNLLAGRPPFLGSNPVSVIRKASETQAPRLRSLAPSLDRDLETICARCLERNPKARYQSAEDLAADLERWLGGHPIVARPVSPPTRIWRWSRRNPNLVGAGVAGLLLGASTVWLFRGEIFRAPPFNPPEKSIAVLPFVNLSTTKDQQYLGDGISEEILRTLAKVDELRVASRTSSFSVKGNANARDVGEKLNVGSVLEGSLRRDANRVRVTAELIDARSGFRLWTETYDREMEGVFALQDEIARSIVDALKLKLAVGVSAQEQPGDGVYDRYLQRLFSDVTGPTGINSIGVSVPLQNPFNPSTVPDHTSAGGLDPRHTENRVSAALPETGLTNNVRHRELEAGVRPNENTADGPASIQGFAKAAKGEPVKDADVRTADPRRPDTRVSAALPETGLTNNVRHRELEAGVRTNKIAAEGPASIHGFVKTAKDEPTKDAGVRSKLEAGVRTNKIAADGPASIQGFVKAAKGEPIKGADVRIESRDGKQVFSAVKTDAQGRYSSQGLQPGIYRVTLLVDGTVKASIMNTHTKANQPTQLNFDIKSASQAGNIAKGGKHMVWVPARTGSHIGGNWVEVDDTAKAHSRLNVQRVTARNW
ncbi:MAG TPA: protein kinase [Candidatus Udaeobacter sp.]|nr:protein kinase [Candidatus Udaeobacter sp.]